MNALDKDIAHFQNMRDTLMQRVEDIAKESGDAGVQEQQNFLRDVAITTTGTWRQRVTGGFPGRYKTGEMHNAIKRQVKIQGSKAMISVGWHEGFGPPYHYSYQEQGTGKIEPAKSLVEGYFVTKEHADRGMRALQEEIWPI